MDSPAPSPTNAKIDIANAIDTAVGIAVLTNIDINAKIDIANAIDTAVGIAMPTNININAETNVGITIDTVASIAVPAIIDANPLEPEVHIMESIIIDIASSNATDLIPAVTIIGPTSGMTGAVSAITGGFDMAFGLFNFHMDNNGVAELISIGDSVPPATTPSTPPVIEGNPSAIAPPTPMEKGPRPNDSTPSVGSNDFKDPSPSPTTAYYADCDAYHFVGAGDFSSHEIAAVKILGEALQLSTRRYPSASGLSMPSRSVPRPTTLIMSKGCTQITHAQTTMTSTPKLKGKSATQTARTRADL
jgi:hypothetical protein